ncbi:MAG TPA: alpha-1,2-fucosyltransferase [Flavisolibacter sp.]|nr:alpha-1,2-fucosyltransferase [Flavisolibacter sp.]
MIILKMMGGMGNQMFQYAFGRYLAHKHQTELKFDLSYLNERPKDGNRVIRDFDLDIFKIKGSFADPELVKAFVGRTGIPIADKVLQKVLGPKKSHMIERDLHFLPDFFAAPDNVYLEGYFASEKYFAPVKKMIAEEFTVKEPLGAKAASLLQEVQGRNSVCVNIRRGDFVTNPTHNICGLDYYAAAEKTMLEKGSDFHFYVFSDDVEWCKENLQFSVPTTFVTHEYKGNKFQDYFRLMSSCQHFIIPNSSFAWWATYLNTKQDKIVIAPSRWLNMPGFTTDDILPASWMKISV